MRADYLNVPSQQRSFQQVFGGYDRRTRIDETQFRDMLNLTGDNYPVLSTRAPRGTWMQLPGEGEDEGLGIFPFGEEGILDAVSVNNGLVYCSSDSVFAGGELLDIELEPSTRRRISPFGKNFFIIPDGLYIKHSNGEYTGSYAATDYSPASPAVTLVTLCNKDGSAIVPDTIAAVAPQSPTDGETWVDTSVTPNILREYSASGSAWIIKESYISLSGTGINDGLSFGDWVFIGGCSDISVNGTHKLETVDDGIIVICGIISAAGGVISQSGISVKRRMPVLDFVIEHNNRLWGCRYGENDVGEFVNEIYCCKLGDSLSWFAYDGISTDSYAASVGCPGEFTGIGKVGNSIVFFKEDYIIKVWGSEPADFQVLTTFAKGVQAGSDRSCVTVNGVLYYKCCGGVMAYDGSLPVSVSSALGDDVYSDACAGTVGGKYYIAMSDVDGKHFLFVYDTATGLWHRESNESNIRIFVYSRNCLYMFCLAAELTVFTVTMTLYVIQICNVDSPGKYTNIFLDTGRTEEDYTYVSEQDMPWFAETGEIGLSSPDNKILRSLQLRVKLGDLSSITVAVMLNSDGEWHELYKSPANAVGSFTICTPFPACDTYRLRLSGEGECTVYSITKVTETARGVIALE